MNKYEILLDVYKTESITKTAKKFHYSQSAVSQVVKSFEDEIGITIFKRSKSGTQALPNTEDIIAALEIINDQENKIRLTANRLNNLDSGYIRIGTIHSIFYKWLSDLLKVFSEEYSNIRFEIIVGGFDELKSALRDNQLDCIFVSRYSAMDYDFISLAADELVLTAPHGHELLDKQVLNLADLNGIDYILSSDKLDYETGKLLECYNVKPNIRFQLNDDYSCLKMVQSGFGVSILPKLLIEKAPFYVETRSFTPKIDRVLGVAFSNEEIQTPALKRFLQFIKDSEYY